MRVISPTVKFTREFFRLVEKSPSLGPATVSRLVGCSLQLVAQYERIKTVVSGLRNSPMGALVAEMRRARQHGLRSPIEDLTEEAEVALEALTAARDFVRAFAQGKISLKTFLRGPQLGDFADLADSEEQFREMLDMVEQLDRAMRRSNRSARAKSKGAKGPTASANVAHEVMATVASRLYCAACKHSQLVAFACKDHVSPVGADLPFAWRGRLAHDGSPLGKLTRLFVLLRRARRRSQRHTSSTSTCAASAYSPAWTQPLSYKTPRSTGRLGFIATHPAGRTALPRRPIAARCGAAPGTFLNDLATLQCTEKRRTL